MRSIKTVRVLIVLVVIGIYGQFGNKAALALTCFSGNNLPCGNGDPTTSACNLSFGTSLATCRSYRTSLSDACAVNDASGAESVIGEVTFTLPEVPSSTWVCYAAVNLRITQGSSAGTWSSSETTTDSPPFRVSTQGSFGGSFGPLTIAAGASDLRQASGVAWGPQLGPFHGGDEISIQVSGLVNQDGAVFDRVNINAMCCQGF
jgi:hypothetical protein